MNLAACYDKSLSPKLDKKGLILVQYLSYLQSYATNFFLLSLFLLLSKHFSSKSQFSKKKNNRGNPRIKIDLCLDLLTLISFLCHELSRVKFLLQLKFGQTFVKTKKILSLF
jgi:hypothetical protein